MSQTLDNPASRAPIKDIALRKSWPTQFFIRKWSEHREQIPGIIKFLYELKEKEDKNIASGIAPTMKPETGLFESDFDLFLHEHPGLQKLKGFIIETVQEVVCGLNGREVPPERINVSLDDAWFHITNDGGFHDTHGHSQCSWCGIYYLQTGDMMRSKTENAPNGANRFYSPFTVGGQHIDYGNKYLTNNIVTPQVEDGMLLLFPSFLEHSALPYTGDQDRIVIAFNSRSAVITN